MSTGSPPGYNATSLSSSAVVKANTGRMIGFLCTSSSSGTVKLWDNASTGAGQVLVDTVSVTAGQWYPAPFMFNNGCYATISNATISIGWM